MNQLYEVHFKGHNDIELFYHYWKVTEPRGTIVITHGLAEHSECYKDLAEKLNQSRYDVLAWDLRGHGRSEGKRGYVEEFDDYIRDFNKFIKVASEHNELEKNHLYLFGHSMGGLITIKALLDHPQIKEVTGVILSAPALGLSVEVPRWKSRLAQVGADWFPKLTMWNEIRYEDLSRDEQRVKSYASDPLRHDKISPGLFLGMMESFKFVHEHEPEFSLPVLVQVAGYDKIVSAQSAIRFYERVASSVKQLHIYEDSYHEIYNDLDKDLVYKDLMSFLTQIGNGSKK